MKHKTTVTLLVFVITTLAILATTAGIFSNQGTGQYEYKSIRNKTVTIYGKGVYHDMSAEVAPQGIAQDYITLFIGIPLLLISLFFFRKGSLKGHFLLAGTLGYFLVTYLFFLLMGMYNEMFLPWIMLLCSSFFAFTLTCFSFEIEKLHFSFHESTPVRLTGSFLVFAACAIGLLWLSIVVPPLIDGTIVPVQTEHYTTLIVQGLDLGILLPLSFISGVLLMRKKPFGYFLAPVYSVFLSILMTALTAKVVSMSILGYNVIPVIFIIPVFNLLSIMCTIFILKNVKQNEYSNK